MPSTTISDPEKARRRKAIDSARGNIGLSGFKISEALEARAQRYVNGEIELADLLNHDSGDAVARITKR